MWFLCFLQLHSLIEYMASINHSPFGPIVSDRSNSHRERQIRRLVSVRRSQETFERKASADRRGTVAVRCYVCNYRHNSILKLQSLTVIGRFSVDSSMRERSFRSWSPRAESSKTLRPYTTSPDKRKNNGLAISWAFSASGWIFQTIYASKWAQLASNRSSFLRSSRKNFPFTTFAAFGRAIWSGFQHSRTILAWRTVGGRKKARQARKKRKLRREWWEMSLKCCFDEEIDDNER